MPRQLLLFICLAAYISSTVAVQAQADRSKYALLWEITGNGLKEPSYLFGSMHIRHKDIFEFPDSMFVYLENCEAFANEIHLDSAMNRFFEVAMSETDHYDKGKLTALPPETESLVPADKRAAFSPPRRKTQQGMPTMLDAYLMNVARAQGKVLYGLENIDEHLGIGEVTGGMTDQSPREFGFAAREEGLEELIDIYQSGDLERISSYVENNGGGEDLELIPRNYIMVESIERITRERSLFSVVGAAHLPGKEGVVELLQKRGYLVRKVEASFKGLAKQYEYTPLSRTWYKTEASDGSFVFETPLPAQSVGRKDLNNYYITFDLGDGMGYVVSAEYILPGAYHNFERQYFEDNGFKVLSADTIVKDGLLGFDYRLAKPDEELKYFRARAYRLNGRLFYQQFSSFLEPNLYGVEAERFFNSLLLGTVKSSPAVLEKKEGAFKALLPGAFSQSTYQDEQGRKQVSVQGVDEKANFFAIRYFDLALQTKVDDFGGDSALLATALAEVALPFGKVFTSVDSMTFVDIPGFSAQVNLSQGAKLYAQAFRRGLRVYILTAAGTDEARTFFSHFSLLPYPNSPLQLYSFEDQYVLGKWPLKPEEEEKPYWQPYYASNYPLDSVFCVAAQDSLSGFLYELNTLYHKPYFRISDYEAYYKSLLDLFYRVPYQVLKSAQSKDESGRMIYTASVQPENSLAIQHIQLSLQGGILLFSRVLGPADWPERAQVDHYFESIALQSAPATSLFDPLKSEASKFLGLIFDRSKSWDNSFAEQAARYPFTESDLPLVFSYLQAERWPDEEPLNTLLRRQLLKSMANIKSPSVLPLFSALWQDPWVKDNYGTDVLGGLAVNKLPAAGEQLFGMIRGDSLLAPDWVEGIMPVYEAEPAQFIRHFAAWQAAYEAGIVVPGFWRLSKQALKDSTFIWNKHLPFYLASARVALAPSAEPALSVEVFSFFAALPSRQAEFDALAQAFFKRARPNKATLAAASYLLAGKQSLPQGTIDKILADTSMFWPLVQVLNRQDRMDLVSATRYPDEYVARQILLAALPEGAAKLGKPIFVKTIVHGQGMERSKVYVFRLPLASGEDYGLGVVAGFDAENKDRDIQNDGLAKYVLEPVQAWQIDDKISGLLTKE